MPTLLMPIAARNECFISSLRIFDGTGPLQTAIGASLISLQLLAQLDHPEADVQCLVRCGLFQPVGVVPAHGTVPRLVDRGVPFGTIEEREQSLVCDEYHQPLFFYYVFGTACFRAFPLQSAYCSCAWFCCSRVFPAVPLSASGRYSRRAMGLVTAYPPKRK